jgi:hypothetical protein
MSLHTLVAAARQPSKLLTSCLSNLISARVPSLNEFTTSKIVQRGDFNGDFLGHDDSTSEDCEGSTIKNKCHNWL